MVLVCEVIPQLFEPEVNIVILYVPGVLNVMFKVLVDVPDQTEGLLGKFALKPKFPTTETNELATRFPDAPTVSSFTFLYNAPAEVTIATPSPSQSEISTPTVNRTTDIFVIALLIFAFIVLIFLSRYAKQTFKAPVKAKKPPIRKSNSRKFLK